MAFYYTNEQLAQLRTPQPTFSQEVRDALAPRPVGPTPAEQLLATDSSNQLSPETMSPELRDQVAVAVEAYSMLIPIDRDEVTESVTKDFAKLETSDKTGEPYIQLPRSIVSLADMISVLDTGTFDRKYASTYVDDKLWTPGTDPNGYKPEELGNLSSDNQDASWRFHGRLAVHNTENPDEPLLHFLNMPFDGKHAKSNQQTQLEAIAEAKQAYEQEHPDLSLTPLNAHAITMVALTRRIKGEAMPLDWGFMRDATLTRKDVGGGPTVVGDVNSREGRLKLGYSFGVAYPSNGVGLSVGPKD